MEVVAFDLELLEGCVADALFALELGGAFVIAVVDVLQAGLVLVWQLVAVAAVVVPLVYLDADVLVLDSMIVVKSIQVNIAQVIRQQILVALGVRNVVGALVQLRYHR